MMDRDEHTVPRFGAGETSPSTTGEIDQIIELADLDADIGEYGQALDRLMQARETFPVLSAETRFPVERRIAACLERLGRADEAQSVARAAIDLAPQTASPIEKVQCLLVAGKAALDLGLLSAARADARSVLETLGASGLLQETGSAHNLLGMVASRSGDTDLARQHFEKALEVFRKLGNLQRLAGTYVNLGNLLKLRCDWERAAEHYQVAYYLGTTLGEYGVVAGAAQNLGIVLSKSGRYGESRTFLQRGLRLAIEKADSIRELRARLELAKIERAGLEIDHARSLLAACREGDPQALPERENCLLLLEEARLDLGEGSLARAESLAAELRLRIEAMAPRGDLMVEVLLLEADIAATRGSWEEVGRLGAEACELAKSHRDRAQEERSQLRLATAWARSGRIGEAETSLAGLVERHQSRGEWPAIASVVSAQGRIAGEVRGDYEAALGAFAKAAATYRQLGLSRMEAMIEAERIGCLIHLGRREEALAQVEMLRHSESYSPPFPRLDDVLQRLSDALREATEKSDGVRKPDGLEVHERLEGILSSPGNTWERLREILDVLRKALEVDGALLAHVQGTTLGILASVDLDLAGGKRTVDMAELGLGSDALDAPTVHSGPDTSGSGSGGSHLTIPMRLRGRPHLLYLKRVAGKGHSAFSRAESNYAMVLVAEIARALELGSSEHEITQLSGGIALADVITQDPQMLQILDLIRRVADTGLTVLLQGETGTGKKLLAQAIHRASGRRGRPIVTVDCAALPESLLEAELFGYQKGAFTGATQDRTGLLAEAAGGTIFLDEIDKAGLTVQRRFLHLLDSGEIRPVGSTSYIRLDVRIVCATSSPDLRTEVAEGRFLKDLYYRLNDISIQIPALRERPNDTLLLASCFVEMYSQQIGRKIRGMSAGFRRLLQAHEWPGNVRELEKAIRRAITLADDDDLLVPELLPSEVQEVMEEVGEEDDGKNLRQQIELFERRAIERTLKTCDGNKSRTAAVLGLSRKGLKGKIARYRIGGRGAPPGV